MSHKLDIGVCSYRNPEKLKRALDSIHKQTITPFKIHVWHNDSDDTDGFDACNILDKLQSESADFKFSFSDNVGYAGAVNGLIAASTAPYFSYCDNDVEILTPGWDERMIEVLEKYPEVGQVFPGAGHYGFHNGRYHECLWNAGYCWTLRKSVFPAMAYNDTIHGTGWPSPEPTVPLGYDGIQGPLDISLGHHEEVDLMIRLRLAGFQIACLPDVQVLHHETATHADSADHKPGGRIHDGVVRWMNKWNRYFCGDQLKYSMTEYDPRALRYTDWPPCALYLERMTLAMFPDWNALDRAAYATGYRIVDVPGVGQMDAVEVLKPKGCYRGRAI